MRPAWNNCIAVGFVVVNTPYVSGIAWLLVDPFAATHTALGTALRAASWAVWSTLLGVFLWQAESVCQDKWPVDDNDRVEFPVRSGLRVSRAFFQYVNFVLYLVCLIHLVATNHKR